jgi:DNA-binding NtrC family response regulator
MGYGTILVVDDEPEQRALMSKALRQEFYDVLEASDCREALAVHARHLGEIVLVLTDVSLPGGNGYELSKALLAAEPHLRLLLMSGHAGAELCKFFNMPTTDLHFLQKPFEPEELLERVRTLLRADAPLTRASRAAS